MEKTYTMRARIIINGDDVFYYDVEMVLRNCHLEDFVRYSGKDWVKSISLEYIGAKSA